MTVIQSGMIVILSKAKDLQRNKGGVMITETWLTRKPSASAWFIAAWSTFFLFMGSLLYWTNTAGATEWMPASYNDIIQRKEIWKLWSTLFAHGDFGHLISNSLLFVVLGFFLSGYFGLFVFPLLAIFMGGLVNIVVLSQYPGEVNLIGMSGVVYWMGGMWLVLYLLLDEQRSWTQRILRSLGVALAIFMPSSAFDPQVSYGAHLVGFILGALSGAIYYFFRRETFKAAIVRVEIPEEEDVVFPPDGEADEATPLGPPRL